VNKQAVLDQIIAVLGHELTVLTRAASDAFAAATDPDSRAENKYDTRSLEASYVARGQAQRVAELQLALQSFQALSGQALPAGSPVVLGALVSLDSSGLTSHYLLAPQAGGTEVMVGSDEISVITPASLLGRKLLGRQVGDIIELRPGAKASVTAVQ
jgi:transcription elongation GreA/GreB family factor